MTDNLKLKFKSPLRYPGGKSRAVSYLLKFIPPGTKEMVSPFFGGGSFELAVADRGIYVRGYDIFTPLVAFWHVLEFQPIQLAEEVAKYYPLSKQRFYELQRSDLSSVWLTRESTMDVAAKFFVLNRASFSGITFSGGMSPGHHRFTRSSIQRLKEFRVKNFTVRGSDFRDVFQQLKGEFIYLDPPYYIDSSLYGKHGDTHKGFPHDELMRDLRQRSNWMLSYNDCEYVRDKYIGHFILTPKWVYGMSKNKASKEVLIFSKDLTDFAKRMANRLRKRRLYDVSKPLGPRLKIETGSTHGFLCYKEAI